MFRDPVTSVETLREIIGGEPSEVARRKELPALDVHARTFIARSPFPAASRGRCGYWYCIRCSTRRNT